MLLDQQNTFFDGNLVAGANNSDVIDMKAPTNLGAANLGMGHGGEGVEVFVRTGTEGNVDNTLALTLEGADDAAMSVNKITVVAAVAADIGGNGQIKRMRVPHHAPKRFFRLVATTGGTTATNTGFKAFLHTTANQRSLAGQGLI